MAKTTDHTLELLKELRKQQAEHQKMTESVLTEVRFLRSRLFQMDDEDEYWRRGTHEMREEIRALTARIERLEDA